MRPKPHTGSRAVTNTIGRVPLHWYSTFDHMGYDRDGNKVMKGVTAMGDAVARAAAVVARDEVEYERTVYDALHDRCWCCRV